MGAKGNVTRVDFDNERHPTDPVCQSGSRVTTGIDLQRRYERAVRKGDPYDMQFVAADAIARVLLLESELWIRDHEQGRRGRAISRPVALGGGRESNVIPLRSRRRNPGERIA